MILDHGDHNHDDHVLIMITKRVERGRPRLLGQDASGQVGASSILEPRRLIVHRKSINLPEYIYIHIFCIFLNIGTRMFIGENLTNIQYEYICGGTNDARRHHRAQILEPEHTEH